MFEYLKEHDVEYKENFKISGVSSIHIGGPAKLIIYPKSEIELIESIDFIENCQMRYKIVGRMTNILASDDGYNGVLISTKYLDSLGVSGCVADAGAGLSVTALISKLAKFNLGGLESLFGIPGTVAGLIYNNGGAFGKDASMAFLSARLYSPKDKKVLIYDNSDMAFEYRKSSLFGSNLIVISAKLAFLKKSYCDIKKEIREFNATRKNTQPTNYPSLGSVFKKENGIAVSKLIDEAGLKGLRVGGAEVSNKHAGFIINRQNATAKDVKELIALIKSVIFKKYGFLPKEEIEFLE